MQKLSPWLVSALMLVAMATLAATGCVNGSNRVPTSHTYLATATTSPARITRVQINLGAGDLGFGEVPTSYVLIISSVGKSSLPLFRVRLSELGWLDDPSSLTVVCAPLPDNVLCTVVSEANPPHAVTTIFEALGTVQKADAERDWDYSITIDVPTGEVVIKDSLPDWACYSTYRAELSPVRLDEEGTPDLVGSAFSLTDIRTTPGVHEVRRRIPAGRWSLRLEFDSDRSQMERGAVEMAATRAFLMEALHALAKGQSSQGRMRELWGKEADYSKLGKANLDQDVELPYDSLWDVKVPRDSWQRMERLDFEIRVGATTVVEIDLHAIQRRSRVRFVDPSATEDRTIPKVSKVWISERELSWGPFGTGAFPFPIPSGALVLPTAPRFSNNDEDPVDLTHGYWKDIDSRWPSRASLLELAPFSEGNWYFETGRGLLSLHVPIEVVQDKGGQQEVTIERGYFGPFPLGFVEFDDGRAQFVWSDEGADGEAVTDIAVKAKHVVSSIEVDLINTGAATEGGTWFALLDMLAMLDRNGRAPYKREGWSDSLEEPIDRPLPAARIDWQKVVRLGPNGKATFDGVPEGTIARLNSVLWIATKDSEELDLQATPLADQWDSTSRVPRMVLVPQGADAVKIGGESKFRVGLIRQPEPTR